MERREFIRNTFFSVLALKISSSYLLADSLSAFSIESILKKAKKEEWNKLKLSNIMMKVGEEFLGVPYVGGTLDKSETESCVIATEGLDCVTFMELTLDLARIIRNSKFSKQDLINEVTFTRYRDGEIKDYDSRLHYTKEWILNNEKKNVIKDITLELKGIPFKNKVGFMSTNPKFYKQLKSNPEMIDKIAEIESKINKKSILYIPSEKIKSIESKLQSGDIIAITTSKDGLDYSHVGLINKEKDGIARFFHASLKHKKVYLDTSISDYLTTIKTNTGITVLRPI